MQITTRLRDDKAPSEIHHGHLPDHHWTVRSHLHRDRRLVLVSAFLCRMLSGGYAVSMGIYFVEFVESFDSGRGLTGLVISLSGGLMYGAGVPASIILHKTNERVCCMVGAVITSVGLAVSYFAPSISFLIVSFGITTGIGMSFVLSSCAAAVNRHFSRGQGAAIAVSESGLTVGGLLFPHLLRFLIDTYSWRGAVLISSATLLNIFPLGFLFPPSVPSKLSFCGEVNDNDVKPTQPRHCFSGIFEHKLFMLYVILSVIVAMGNAYVYAIIVDLGRIRGYGDVKSTYLVMALSAANILGVAIMALLLKVFWSWTACLHTLNIMIMSVSMYAFPLSKTYTSLVLVSVLYGMTAGGLYGTYIAIVPSLLDKQHYTLGTGITCTAYGLGTALSTPVAGWIKDLTGDYQNSFFVGSGLCMGSIIIFGVVLAVRAFRYRATGKEMFSFVVPKS